MDTQTSAERKPFPANHMNRLSLIFCQTYILFALLAARAAPSTFEVTTPPHAFENEIAAFERVALTNPPPQHAILFLGSSSIRKWTTLAQDFPTHTVVNRGFGGSQIADSIFFFDRVVLPLHPKAIIFYAGSNDLAAGKKPARVAADFQALADKVSSELPGTKLAFISINASPSRWKQRDQVGEANRLISDIIAKHKQMLFIDNFASVLDAKGQPRPELYQADRLHLNAKGYAIWKDSLTPYLAQLE